MPSLTSARSALFLLCLCLCPNFCCAEEIRGLKTGAALSAKKPCPFAVPTLGLAWVLPAGLLGTWLRRLGNTSA